MYSSTFNGVIGTGGQNNNLNLTKIGSGTLTLGGASALTGAVTIAQGTLRANYGANQRNFGTFNPQTLTSLTIDPGATLASGGAYDGSLFGYWWTPATWITVVTNAGIMNCTSNYLTMVGKLVMAGGELKATGAGNATFGTWSLNEDVTVTADSLISAANVNLAGNKGPAQRKFTVNSGATLNVPGFFRVAATGIFKDGAGTMVLSGANAYTGPTTANAGTLVLGAAGSKYVGTIKGDLIVSNATVQVTGENGIWGWAPTALRNITLGAGAVLSQTNNKASTIGNLTMAGGTLTSVDNGDPTWGSWSIKPPVGDTVTVTVAASSLISAPRVALNAHGATTVFDVTNGATLTVSGSLITAGWLNKTGAGKMLIAGTNCNYTGDTTVNAGTLLMNGAHTNGSGYSVNGGVLGGTGTIWGTGAVAVAAGGTLTAADANSTGTLRIKAPVNLQPGGTLLVNIAPGGYDQIDMSGGAGSFAPGDANLQIVVTPPSYKPADGDEYAIVSGFTGTLTGTFHNLAEGACIAVGKTFYEVRYDDAGHRIVLTAHNLDTGSILLVR